jgi:hypothetical protein
MRQAILEAQKRFQRRLRAFGPRYRYWKKRTGLLPPEHRGFVPRQDGDERPAQIDEQYEKELDVLRLARARLERECEEEYPRQPKWSLPATPDDESPSWHNVVRAYEEDR